MTYDFEFVERFWSIVEIKVKCWEWTGAITKAKYGLISYKNKRLYVHRVSFELFTGIEPKNLEVCHRCDNTICVKPDHLFLGTHKENMYDMINKKRDKLGGRVHV